MRKYPSLYEHLNGGFTTVMKQRFVDEFSGATLDATKWRIHGSGGSVSIDQDTVDGGLKIISATNAGKMIDTANANNSTEMIRPFNRQGCVMIAVMKLTQAQYAIMNVALTDSWYTEASSYVESLVQGVTNGNSYDNKFTLKSTEFTDIHTDQTGLYDFHNHKLECKTSTTELSIDGILKATGAGVPDNAVMPKFNVAPSESTVAAQGNITYMEVYNT